MRRNSRIVGTSNGCLQLRQVIDWPACRISTVTWCWQWGQEIRNGWDMLCWKHFQESRLPGKRDTRKTGNLRNTNEPSRRDAHAGHWLYQACCIFAATTAKSALSGRPARWTVSFGRGFREGIAPVTAKFREPNRFCGVKLKALARGLLRMFFDVLGGFRREKCWSGKASFLTRPQGLSS